MTCSETGGEVQLGWVELSLAWWLGHDHVSQQRCSGCSPATTSMIEFCDLSSRPTPCLGILYHFTHISSYLKALDSLHPFLRTKDLQLVLHRLHFLRLELLSLLIRGVAKDQLRLLAPFQWDLVLGRDLFVGKRVVVLQIAAETFGLEGGPEHVLVHGGGVLAPWWELVGVLREFFLEGFDGGGVFVEQDLSCGVSECEEVGKETSLGDSRCHSRP